MNETENQREKDRIVHDLLVREYWKKAYENNTKELQYEPTAVLASLPTKTNARKRITLKELIDFEFKR